MMSAEHQDTPAPSASYAPCYASLHAKQRMRQRNGLVLTPGQWEAIVLQAIEGGFLFTEPRRTGAWFTR